MELPHAFSVLLNRDWTSGRVYWISCKRAQVDFAFATIANSLPTGEIIKLEADLRKGGPVLLWDLLAALKALPQGIALVESDLEFLLLELPESIDENFRRKTLLIRLSAEAEVTEDKTPEAVAVLRLARSVLGDSLRFIVLDCVGQIQD